MNINKIEASASKVSQLTSELSRSLRRPSSRTLSLIEKALSYLTPFESPRASVASPSERHDLLNLLDTHREILCPYINADRIECNLRFND